MNAPLPKSGPMTCEVSRSAISSPESAAGPTRCDSQAGPMTDLFGRALAPASRSAQPARVASSTMRATYGRLGSGSSESAALSLALASRLQALTPWLGSTMFQLTWKARVTPSGRSIPALRASAPRTSGSGCTGWPTVTVHDAERGGQAKRAMGEDRHGSNLQDFALLTGWPTPVANDDNKSVEAHLAMKQRMGERDGTGANRTAITSLQVASQLASWASPRAEDSESSGMRHSRGVADTLTAQSSLSSWATPSSRDFKSNEGTDEFHAARLEQTRGKPLSEQAHQLAQSTVFGETPNGSPAGTEKRGQLNPALSRWLQALPPEWCDCAVTAMRSMPSKRGHSSKRT